MYFSKTGPFMCNDSTSICKSREVVVTFHPSLLVCVCVFGRLGVFRLETERVGFAGCRNNFLQQGEVEVLDFAETDASFANVFGLA